MFVTLEQEGELPGTRPARNKQSLPRSEYPESALRWLLSAWYSQVELGRGVRWGLPPKLTKDLCSTHQPAWDPAVFSLLSYFLLLSDVSFTRKLNFNANRAKLYCQIWVAEMCGKVRSLDLGSGSGRVGHELL